MTQKQEASGVQNGNLPYILTSTQTARLHMQGGLKNSRGRKPAYVHIMEQCEFILTVEFSIFRLFLHCGKHLQVIHALSQGADLLFLQKSTHLGVDVLSRHKNSLTLAITEIC